jgi:membrane-associated phospholipid phosphatase
VLLVATWYAAFHIGFVTDADQSIFRGFFLLSARGRVYSIADFVASLCNPRPYVYFVPIPIVVALLRGKPRVAIAVAVLLFGANVSTHLLKPLLAEPRAQSLLGFTTVSRFSWPSGHATAAMSLALAFVIAFPARMRPTTAALGALFAVAVSYSFLTLGWHYPSDVFGGFLVATTWALVALGGLKATEGRTARGAPATARDSIAAAVVPVGAAMVGAVVLAAVVLLLRPHEVVGYAHQNKEFVVGAAAIAAFSFALSTAVLLTTGTGRAPTAAHRRRWRPG